MDKGRLDSVLPLVGAEACKYSVEIVKVSMSKCRDKARGAMQTPKAVGNL